MNIIDNISYNKKTHEFLFRGYIPLYQNNEFQFEKIEFALKCINEIKINFIMKLIKEFKIRVFFPQNPVTINQVENKNFIVTKKEFQEFIEYYEFYFVANNKTPNKIDTVFSTVNFSTANINV